MTIKSYLLRAKVEKKLWQAYLDPELFDRLTKTLKREKIKRAQFLEAAVKEFLKDFEKRP